MNRLPAIHGLRAIAALCVVIFHLVYVTNLISPPAPLNEIVPHLQLCVPLFFVISAFSLAYAHDHSVGREGWIGPYLLKRFFRIAPLFYVMLVVWHTVWWKPPLVILANVAFVFNFIPERHESIVWAGWSIGVEMPFYLAFPFILERVRWPVCGLALLAAAAAISIGARLWLAQINLSSLYAQASLASNIAFFAAGLLAYQCFTRWRKHTIVWKWTAAAVIVCLALLPFRSHVYFPGQPDAVLWGLVFAALCAWQAAAPSRWLASAPMQWLGERSFSIYLLHPFVIFGLMSSGAYDTVSGAWGFFPCVVMTYAILLPTAGATYALIERPGQKLGSMATRVLWGPTASKVPQSTPQARAPAPSAL